MCFSFAWKIMAGDASLEALHEFLRVGDEDSAKRLIKNLHLSSVVNAENIDLHCSQTTEGHPQN